jgi:hypothetical protein
VIHVGTEMIEETEEQVEECEMPTIVEAFKAVIAACTGMTLVGLVVAYGMLITRTVVTFKEYLFQ